MLPNLQQALYNKHHILPGNVCWFLAKLIVVSFVTYRGSVSNCSNVI